MIFGNCVHFVSLVPRTVIAVEWTLYIEQMRIQLGKCGLDLILSSHSHCSALGQVIFIAFQGSCHDSK